MCSLSSHKRLAAGLALALLLLATGTRVHAQPTRIEPLASDYVTIPEAGRMSGTITRNVQAYGAEEFGDRVFALGDLNHDGRADWALSRIRCDTTFNGLSPKEVLVYYGEQGRLPLTSSGIRIGPTELLAQSQLLCAGDWDGDSFNDLAVAIHLLGDTSGAPPSGRKVSRLIIFWNNGTGQFSIADTTQLSCDGQIWIGINNGVNGDFDEDGTDDLLIRSGNAITQGLIQKQPLLRIFQGRRGQRWGEGTTRRTAEWFMWNLPPISRIELYDQDCDSHPDVIFHLDNTDGSLGNVAVLYGRSRSFPDTLDLQSVEMVVAGGHYSLFADVTGDKTLDLVVNTGHEGLIKVFAGRPHQRLLEQYGSGNDSTVTADRPWASPWAAIWSPRRLHDGWTGSGWSPMWSFGDMDHDGVDEIFTESDPFLIGYQAGKYIDSLIDLSYRYRGNGIHDVTQLGDIDGSGENMVAISYYTNPNIRESFPGGVVFVKPLPRSAHRGATRALPHVRGEVCGPTAAASTESPAPERSVEVIPNPASGRCRIRWIDPSRGSRIHMTVTDITGRTMIDQWIDTDASMFELPGADLPPGIYYIRLLSGGAVAHARLDIAD